MKEQRRLLRVGDFDGFYRSEFMEANAMVSETCPFSCRDVNMSQMVERRKYFEPIIESVGNASSRVEIIESDVFEFLESLKESSVDKVYLSNVFEWRGYESLDKIVNAMRAVREGGLVYDNARDYKNLSDKFSINELQLDKNKTLEVREIQSQVNNFTYHWEPCIYRKIK